MCLYLKHEIHKGNLMNLISFLNVWNDIEINFILFFHEKDENLKFG